MNSLLLVPILSLAAGVPGDECSAKAPTVAKVSLDGKTIVQTAVDAGSFRTLAAALKAADLVGALEGEGPFTVFAPTDDAFAALPEGTLETLLKPENKGLLTSILTYHVVPGSAKARDVVQKPFFTTLNGQRVDVKVSEAGVMLDGAHVVKTDIQCSNGIIHVIDAVILPNNKNIVETAVEAGSFKTLAAALEAARLVKVLSGEGPFTVFAPTDAAFAKLPAGTVESLLLPENREKLANVLKYHVVSGRVYANQAMRLKSAKTLLGQEAPIVKTEKGLTIAGAKIVRTDIETANGVIHVIDSVMLPQ